MIFEKSIEFGEVGGCNETKISCMTLIKLLYGRREVYVDISGYMLRLQNGTIVDMVDEGSMTRLVVFFEDDSLSDSYDEDGSCMPYYDSAYYYAVLSKELLEFVSRVEDRRWPCK